MEVAVVVVSPVGVFSGLSVIDEAAEAMREVRKGSISNFGFVVWFWCAVLVLLVWGWMRGLLSYIISGEWTICRSIELVYIRDIIYGN